MGRFVDWWVISVTIASLLYAPSPLPKRDNPIPSSIEGKWEFSDYKGEESNYEFKEEGRLNVFYQGNTLDRIGNWRLKNGILIVELLIPLNTTPRLWETHVYEYRWDKSRKAYRHEMLFTLRKVK